MLSLDATAIALIGDLIEGMLRVCQLFCEKVSGDTISDAAARRKKYRKNGLIMNAFWEKKGICSNPQVK
jgi:hypothetical protein